MWIAVSAAIHVNWPARMKIRQRVGYSGGELPRMEMERICLFPVTIVQTQSVSGFVLNMRTQKEGMVQSLLILTDVPGARLAFQLAPTRLLSLTLFRTERVNVITALRVRKQVCFQLVSVLAQQALFKYWISARI